MLIDKYNKLYVLYLYFCNIFNLYNWCDRMSKYGVSDYNDLMKKIKKIIIKKALNSELYYHLEEDSKNNSCN